MRANPSHGVLLMTYGSPSSLDDVPRYISAVRGGREVSAELVEEFRRRYALIGGSPLIEITQAQAAALASTLGSGALVRAAMRFSPPTITDAIEDLAKAGVREAIGIIMSPQYSPLLMSGYARAVDAARAELEDAPRVTIAGPWHLEPAFQDALAERVRTRIARFVNAGEASPAVLFTAHSLPRRVAEQEPDYLEQLRETAQGVASRAGLGATDWRFCWQSAGHEPGEWMKPDFADLMPELAAEGRRSVLVAPVQFLADHLEILYDIDVAARAQAQQAGLVFARTESLNADPRFIEALASLARRAHREASEHDRAVVLDRR